MTNIQLLNRVVVAVLIGSLVFTSGCKKDENMSGAINRITKLTYFENDEIKWIYDYSYKNDIMTKADITIFSAGNTYNSDWGINYPTDDSIISYFTISGNSPDTREILELSDGLTVASLLQILLVPGTGRQPLYMGISFLDPFSWPLV